MRFGIGWYTAATYIALLHAAEDREDLPETFGEWEKKAKELLITLRREGMQPEQVFVNVAELVAWCREKRVPVTGPNRAQFVSEKVNSQPLAGPLNL